MQGNRIYTTYYMLEIFPVVGLEFLISTSKVFEIGFSEFKGYLGPAPSFLSWMPMSNDLINI